MWLLLYEGWKFVREDFLQIFAASLSSIESAVSVNLNRPECKKLHNSK
jgi:hypothetical protein